MAEEDVKKESSLSSDLNKEEDPIPKNHNKMLKILLQNPYSINEIENLIEDYCTADIRDDIENTRVHVSFKNKTLSYVTFKTPEFAEQAHLLLRGKDIIVFIGTFDPITGKKMIPDGTPIQSRKLSCYICRERGHKALTCPKRENNSHDTGTKASLSKATKRPAADDTGSPSEKKIKKYEVDFKRVIKLTHVPWSWDVPKIREFIKENTKENEEIYRGIQYVYKNMLRSYDEIANEGKCHVLFATPELATAAKQMINDKAIVTDKGKRIWAAYDNKKLPVLWLPNNVPDISAMKERSIKLKKEKKLTPSENRFSRFERDSPNPQTRRDLPANFNKAYFPSPQYENSSENSIFENAMLSMKHGQDIDTYGLSKDFLDSIGVSLPLTTKIFVDFLDIKYDDENLIRKLFSHAGTVTSVTILTRINDFLKVKVDFDHPVEAVQAVAMFNGQIVYQRKLDVCLDKNTHKRFLPPGLQDFGPGLGTGGLPVTNIRQSIELHKAINSVMNEVSVIKLENKTGANEAAGGNDAQKTLATLVSSLTNTATNPLLALNALLNPQTTQMLQLLTQQNTANNLTTGPSTPQASSGWNLGQLADAQNTQYGYNYNMLTTTNMQGQNMQNVPNTQGQNMQNVPNMQGQNMQNVPNMQGQNMHSVPNRQGQNMQGVPNMQGRNTQGQNMQGVPNMQGQNTQGQNMRGQYMTGCNMPAYNIQSNVANVPATANILSTPVEESRLNRQVAANSLNQVSSGPHQVKTPVNAESARRRHQCSVVFNNLPPSVTVPALHNKMREIGEVRSADLTGLGRAVVTFYSPRDAEACIEILDRTKVDGQAIDVKYL